MGFTPEVSGWAHYDDTWYDCINIGCFAVDKGALPMGKLPDRTNSVQSAFMDWMVESGVPVDVFTTMGKHFEGVIVDYDYHSVRIDSVSGKTTRLVELSNVTVIRPKAVPSTRMPRRIRAPRRKGFKPLAKLRLPVIR